MKYAVVECGGKQYKAVEGGIIQVDRMLIEDGEKIAIESVLMVVDEDKVSVGKPTVAGAKVQATVLGEVKGKKVVVFKYRPKKRYRVKTGHRQKYTRLEINTIEME